jgi:DNA-binding response OmpR family regulator/DNA-binding CsgD family transcriptional regulator
MDWELPVLNGIDAIRSLKKNETTHTIPVIMCTGVMMTSEDLQTAFEAGAIDYIRKPVDKTELIARTRSILMLSEYFTEKQKAEVTIHELTREIQEREIARLTTDLEFRNRELTAKAMFLLQKDELLSRTVEILDKIVTGNEEEFICRINALIKTLKMNRMDKTWQEFETHFNQVDATFYQRLMTRFPTLTSNEKKLCAFIRLNLSTKEICAITQRSQKSIEMARTRLRQRLNLLRDQPLSAVIAAI